MFLFKSRNSGKKNKSEEAINREIAQFLGPPTSCSDLGKLGYTLNGYYLVKNKNSIVIDYCMFRQAQGLPTTSKQGNKDNKSFF